MKEENVIDISELDIVEEEFLHKYDETQYKSPSNTVDILLFSVDSENNSLKILMGERKGHPYRGHWAIPGGFVDIDEDIDIAAFRELKEETNVEDVYIEQLYTWGDVKRDPRKRIISISYMALTDSTKLDAKAGSDIKKVKWFTVNKKILEESKINLEDGYTSKQKIKISLIDDEGILPEQYAIIEVSKKICNHVTTYKRKVLERCGVAFDHAVMIEYGIERLKNKISYTDIAFSLLPKRFTLNQLRKVYEIILQKELDPSNFRKKIMSMNMVIKTDEKETGVPYRPSYLYQFNPEWKEDLF